MFNNKLHEYSYTDIADGDVKGKQSNVDWFGFSDKYWLIAIAPPEACYRKIRTGEDRSKSEVTLRNIGYNST